jgi:putative tryptophan/tyrosine transport system substrate-binding protein
MNRRDMLRWLGALMLCATGPASAQAAKGMRRIAWLTGGSPKSHARFLQAFRDGLKEYGWTEGRNVALELRWAEGQMDRLPSLAAELVRSKPDVIVTAANVVHLAVKKETASIPIVMATGADPVAAGLVASLARPGGNLTGLSGFFEATPIKMLELAAAIAPRGARVAVLVDVNTPFSTAPYRAEIERTGKAVAMRTEFVETAALQDTLRVLDALGKSPPAALIVLPSPMFLFMGEGLVKAAQVLKVPVIYPFEELTEAGGLMSYAAPVADSYRRAAYYVDRILRGAKPAELPIEQPTRLALAINLKSAGMQGIRIPQELLLRADRVIE